MISMTVIKASEARSQWKELLDRAVQGEVIKIERAGVEFYLGTTNGVSAGQQRVVETAISLGEHMERHSANKKPEMTIDTRIPGNVSTPIMTNNNRDMQFCTHNAVKGFCKKGCK